MRKSVKALCLIILLVAAAPSCVCRAQGAAQGATPDLSGEWVPEGNQVGGDGSRLLIEHREPELRIKRLKGRSGAEVLRESVYYTDNRGETNRVPTLTDRPAKPAQEDELRTKTAWRGDKLVTRGLLRKLISGRPLDAVVTEEWKLSKDGRRLTHATRFVLGGISTGPSEFKAVYRRASP
jgi:hypothetical protein